jgi:hypothetical protein
VALRLEELNEATREFMLAEFEREEMGTPYRSPSMSSSGRTAWPGIMRVAITEGDDAQLQRSISPSSLWLVEEPYVREGVQRMRKVNVAQRSEQLATSEFNTWYVRGLTAKLMEEGVEWCQVYRAAPAKYEIGECAMHEGKQVKVSEVYEGHRRRYWPEPGDARAFSIPFQPGCHHSIRRL